MRLTRGWGLGFRGFRGLRVWDLGCSVSLYPKPKPKLLGFGFRIDSKADVFKQGRKSNLFVCVRAFVPL